MTDPDDQRPRDRRIRELMDICSELLDLLADEYPSSLTAPRLHIAGEAGHLAPAEADPPLADIIELRRRKPRG